MTTIKFWGDPIYIYLYQMPTGSTNLCILILCRNLFSLICLVLGGCGPVNRLTETCFDELLIFCSPARGVYQYITIINYNKLLIWRFFIGFPLSVLKSCHANAMPMPPRPKCGAAKSHWCIRTAAYGPFGNAHMPVPPETAETTQGKGHDVRWFVRI